MKTRNLTLAVVILLSFLKNIDAQTIDRGPYLQTVNTNSIYIHWRTDSNTNSKVWYGNAPNNLTSTLSIPGNRTDHEIYVSGLAANTIYYYAVGNSNGQMAGGDADHYFKTAPSSSEPIRIWVLGDAGKKNANQAAVRDAYYNYVGNSPIDMMLLLGDNAYSNGDDEDYQEAWFEDDYGYPERLINSVMWPTFGNHEAYSSNSNTQTGPYYDIFNLPTNGEAGGVGSGTEAYYSFDYGNMHVICLNSEDIDDSEDSPMMQWLQNDVDANTKEWLVAIFHHPAYTVGVPSMEANALPILEEAGCDLVLLGHHHRYERSFFINGHYGSSMSFDPETMTMDDGDGKINGDGAYIKTVGGVGTIYVTTGSAGSAEPGASLHPIMEHNAEMLGSVDIQVNDMQMDVKFIDSNGNIEDYFTILKNDPPIVNITNPSDDEYFSAPQDVVITATASDNGTISQVEFFIDNISIGIDYNFPYSKLWSISNTGVFEIKAVATDNLDSKGSKVINVDVGAEEVCAQISNDNNDVEEKPDGDMKLTSSDLELIQDTQEDQIIGLRFTGLNILQGAIINSAYLQFTCQENDNINPCVLEIYAQDSNNALAFTSTDYNLSNRPKTTTMVSWSPDDWLLDGESGLAQKTGDISSVIQEVVNRSNFVDNSPIVIIIEGSGKREAESFNGSPGDAPVLCVEFSINAPLPIELLNFSAKAIEKEIELKWTTASEQNNESFTIERSIDGRNFQEIGIRLGVGTTTEISNYIFVDKYPAKGLNYYRLKQTDFDRNFSFSEIVSAEIQEDRRFLIYPSKVSETISVEKGMDVNEEVTIIIYDLAGRSHCAFKFPADEKKMELSLTDLDAGTYFMSLFDSRNKQTFKFVKL